MHKNRIVSDWTLQYDSPLGKGSKQPFESHPGCINRSIYPSIQEYIVDPSAEGAT